MIIEPEKRSDFESRVREALHLYAYKFKPEFYDDEETIKKLADLVGWNQQSPIKDKNAGVMEIR